MQPTDTGAPTPPRAYSVFVSYARRDDAWGWVTRLIEALLAEIRQVFNDDFEVLSSHNDQQSQEEWRTQLARTIRDADVLVTCVSKPYFESDFCLWEFQEYESKPTDPDGPAVLVPVLLEDTSRDDQPDEEHRHWHDRIHLLQGIDMRDVFTRDAAETLEGLKDRVRALADDLYWQRQNRRHWDTSIGNLKRGTSRFVGRRQALIQLSEALASPSSTGAAVVVQGLGGTGKTELVRHYGHLHREFYAAGIWQIPSEGAKEMLPLLARLAPELPDFRVPEEARNDLELVGCYVLAELRGCTVNGKHVLLVLDDVSDPALLTNKQLSVLPEDSDLHVVITTRLGPEDFSGSPRLKQIHLHTLSIGESVSLLQALQTDRDGEHTSDFRSEDDRAAARELAELLDGFTLAVEQAGVYLFTHPEITVRDYLTYLHSQNLTVADDMLTDAEKSLIAHSEKLTSVTLDQSLTDLENTLPGALQVLQLAAAMPPDTIPWPWLEELTQTITPDAFTPTPQFPKGRWVRIRRTLEGRDLITKGRYPGITGRLHRLIADHLKKREEAESALVDDFVIQRAEEIGVNSTKTPKPWEVDALMDTLPHILQRNPESLEKVSGFIRKVAPEYLTDTRITTMLQNLIKEFIKPKTRASCLAHLLLADLLQDIEPENAFKNYQKALRIINKIAKNKFDNPRSKSGLAISFDRVAEILRYINPSRALEAYEESLTIRRDLVKAQPGSIQTQRNLTTTLDNVANTLRDINPSHALNLYQESLTINRHLTEIQPGSLHAKQNLAISLNNVAEILNNSDPERALNLYQESLTIRRDLVKAQPGSIQTQRNLTTTLDNVANTLRDINPSHALNLYQESLTINRHLTEIQPGSLHAKQNLAISLNNVAEILNNSDPERALNLYQESLAINRHLTETQPGSIQTQRNLATSLNNVADILHGVNPSYALRLYEESLTIRHNLATRLSGDFRTRRDLAIALSNVAGMLKNSDPTQALTLYKESLDISQELTTQLPGDFQVRRDLTVALINVAGMLKYSDPGQALKFYEESLGIRRELAIRLPGNLQALWDLGVSAAGLAQLLPTKDPEQVSLLREAAISFRDALAIRPEHQELGDLSYHVALDYAYCDPDDRDEWLAYAAELAERFRFEKS